MVELTAASRSLYLMAGGAEDLGELLDAGELVHALRQRHAMPVPRCVPSVRVKRQFLQAMPICSIMVKPAPGTYSSASFSDGSMVM